jgi:hypothetical protein
MFSFLLFLKQNYTQQIKHRRTQNKRLILNKFYMLLPFKFHLTIHFNFIYTMNKRKEEK